MFTFILDDGTAEVFEERRRSTSRQKEVPFIDRKKVKISEINAKVKDYLNRESSKARTHTARGKYKDYTPEEELRLVNTQQRINPATRAA